MLRLTWLIPALPLLGFVLLALFGKRLGNPFAGWVGTFFATGSFVAAVLVFAGLYQAGGERNFEQHLFTWLPAGDFSVDIGFLVDPLSATMILFVTGIAALIHLYSIGYMHHDENFPKFFAYLNLFVFSMLMLVLGNNLLLTFLGWEGVGACSYFLISFWFQKEANASAGKKAFITNRVGDWGFMVAIFVVFLKFGSLNYSVILPAAGGLARTTATFIAVMLFVGACGKSAQIPLYIWLPDAMAGPTPVSALIHAATMVTAGVYLMVRCNAFIAASAEWVSWLIAAVGCLTAFVAAMVGTSQYDIKKVLAYSTVSQLGYMFLAVGSGAYVAAIFHMITHAFFKACLFLGSGSVIHGMGDEQDMRFMGRLQRFLPITSATFIVAWLAIAGVPPFSGFWSKDEILEFAYLKSPILGFLGLVTALITAYYMTRQVTMVFWAPARWGEHAVREEVALAPAAVVAAGEGEEADAEAAAAAEVPAGEVVTLVNGLPVEGHEAVVDPHFHPHESGPEMTIPLIVLAVLAVFGGFLNLPFTHGTEFLASWLEPAVRLGYPGGLEPEGPSPLLKVLFAAMSTLVAAAGIAYARSVFKDGDRAKAARFEPALLQDAWRYDRAVTAFMGGPGRRIFDGLAWFDRTVVDGAVNGTGVLIRSVGRGARRIQSGYVRSYALGVAVGAVVVVVLMAVRVLSF